MPLIQLPPLGKDVPVTFNLPEEVANDINLYARFLKATHESAPSAIVAECIRRTFKEDADFQTWKVTPSGRQLARPQKTNPPGPKATTPPQTETK